MKLGPLACICIIIVIIITIVVLIVFTIKITEKYKIMRDLEKTPIKDQPIFSISSNNDDDEPKSLKYRDHRYDRHHIRSNPHVRRYQDNIS